MVERSWRSAGATVAAERAAQAEGLAANLAGGYGVQIEQTVQVQLNTYRVALDYWRRWQRLRA